MAQLFLQFPQKSAENRKAVNVCEHCQRKGMFSLPVIIQKLMKTESETDWSAPLAVSMLRDGIVHMTIDKFTEGQLAGYAPKRKDIDRLWEALVDAACKRDCGCAKVLRQHVSLPYLR